MFRKIVLMATAACLLLAVSGCSSFPFLGKNASPKENEAEIIVNIGATVYNGKFNVFLNGESRQTVGKNGGTARFIVPNGQNVIMVVWQESNGTNTEMASIQVRGNSNKTVLYVTKPMDGEKMEILLGGYADLPATAAPPPQ